MKKEILMYNHVNKLAIATNHWTVTKDSLLWSEPHIHDEIEIIYTLKEHLLCNVENNAEFTVEAGEVVIFNKNIVHETRAVIGTEYYLLQIPCDFYLSESALVYSSFHLLNASPYLHLKKDSPDGQQIKNYIECLFSPEAKMTLFSNGYVMLIIAFLQKKGFIPTVDNIDLEGMQKIMPTIQFLNDHYKERISSAEIANHANFNIDYLERVFKKTLNITITDYLNILRINEAKRLLGTSSHTIDEIVDLCAFSSVTYFNKIFKKLTSYTPSMYRKFKLTTFHPDTYVQNPEYVKLVKQPQS